MDPSQAKQSHDMDINTMGCSIPSLSMRDYVAELAKTGKRVVPGSSGTFWISYEGAGMVRLPTFVLATPAHDEIWYVFVRGKAAVVSFLREPNGQYPTNAWLYICSDQTYRMEKLAPAMRRNVRRGLKELRIAPITTDQLLAHGAPAFSDTRRRVGLSDGTPEEFVRRFALRSQCPGHVFLGAWKGKELAAFLSIIEVEDWAEIEGCFSRDALLDSRPNDALLYVALSRYLVEERRRLVSYGVSSIQSESNAVGLHAFKVKVGFQTQPVHRVFIFHPFLRPFANRLGLWGIKAIAWFSPRNRVLKKAEGVLAAISWKQGQNL